MFCTYVWLHIMSWPIPCYNLGTLWIWDYQRRGGHWHFVGRGGNAKERVSKFFISSGWHLLMLWVCNTCKTTYSLQSHTHILNEGWGGAWVNSCISGWWCKELSNTIDISTRSKNLNMQLSLWKFGFYNSLPTNGPAAPLKTGISVLSHSSSTLRTLTQTWSIKVLPTTQVIASTSTSSRDKARIIACASSTPASQSIISFLFAISSWNIQSMPQKINLREPTNVRCVTRPRSAAW